MAMKKNTSLCLVLIVFVSVLLGGCVSSTAPSVKIGNDEIPTLYSVVGERKILNTESGTQSGIMHSVRYLKLTYNGDVVSKSDLESYIKTMCSDHDFILRDSSSSTDYYYTQLVKESVDSGKVIMIEIETSEVKKNSYTVIGYYVGEGSLDPDELIL